MSVSATGGLRDNKGKQKVSLVPASLEYAVAKVIWQSSIPGGGKYPLHNYKKGMPFTEVGDSMLRHAKKWLQQGEDLDSESGLNHLYHVACNVAFLIEYLETHPEMDDRYKPKKKVKKNARTKSIK